MYIYTHICKGMYLYTEDINIYIHAADRLQSVQALKGIV